MPGKKKLPGKPKLPKVSTYCMWSPDSELKSWLSAYCLYPTDSTKVFREICNNAIVAKYCELKRHN